MQCMKTQLSNQYSIAQGWYANCIMAFLNFLFLDAKSFSIWSISHYYFDFKSKDIERGKLFFNEMFSIEGVKFSSFDLLWLVLNMIIYLLCFQFEGKQMFSCPVIIVEALENVTNFVSILKRYVIWYIWIWYCSSIFFFLFICTQFIISFISSFSKMKMKAKIYQAPKTSVSDIVMNDNP